MIRKTKNGDSYDEIRVVSTHDVFMGTDNKQSLDSHIKELDEKINRLEKWTKFLTKYGGMGSGGSGGGGGTTTFKVYIMDDISSVEVSGQNKVNLWGSGTYNLVFNLVKTLGHSFNISYTLGNGSTLTKTIPEGAASLTTSIRLSEKVKLTYNILDNSTGESISGDQYCTLIPNSYVISPTLIYKSSGGIVTKNDAVSFEIILSGLKAKFDYTISEDIAVKYYVRYKLETLDTWTLLTDIKEFPHAIDDPIIGTDSIDLDLSALTEEQSLGVKIRFELIYGLNEETAVVTEEGTYEETIKPAGNYVLLSDNGEGTLYLLEISEEDEVNKIKKGLLPFSMTLYSNSSGTNVVYINLYRKTGVNTWTKIGDAVGKTVQNNTLQSIAGLYRISVSESGIYKIVGSLDTSGTLIPTTKYFCVRETSSGWRYTLYEDYGETIKRSTDHIYYTESATNPFLTTPIEISNLPIVFDYATSLLGALWNYNISLGLQYDSSNEDSIPFLSLIANNDDTIDIYLNKVSHGTSTIINEYYFPKTINSDSSNKDLWHLLSINVTYIKLGESGSPYYYEFALYIDGKLEGIGKGEGNSTALDKNFGFTKAIINPRGNQILKLNLFDIAQSALPSGTNFTDIGSIHRGKYSFCYDAYATVYYNRYLEDVGFDTIDIKDSSSFNDRILSEFKFDLYSLPYLTYSALGDLISTSRDDSDERVLKTPVIVMCPNEMSSTEVGKDGFFNNWFLAKWPESPTTEALKPSTLTGYIYYVPGGNNVDTTGGLANFLITENERPVSFSFDILGSSTRSFGNKNIELGIVQTSSATTRVFTPNFDASDTKTLLPETSFTFKADMVDSSACNNNAIGDFINANTKPLDSINCKARSTSFGLHIKNCLTGTPILVFIHVDNEDSSREAGNFYFAGIYNMNLGRNSYFNLGYYDQNSYEGANSIAPILTDLFLGEFRILDIAPPTLVLNLTVTEISNGNTYFDFSQYQNSVLFAAEDGDDYAMFSKDDSLYSSEIESKTLLENAVKQIALSGGYLFGELGKNFVDISDVDIMPYQLQKDHVSLNYVSSYTTLYRRTPLLPEFIKITDPGPTGLWDNLVLCVGTLVPDPSSGELSANVPYVDLRALVEYYVICMAFGMTDSVLKNMLLKSWGTKTVFPAFYDMDTALGVDNNGDSVNFFAFSDYWLNADEREQDIVKSKGVEIYPDFFDDTSGYTGFDIPSSYLFSIAKYATMDKMLTSQCLPKIPAEEARSANPVDISPVNIYALLRCTLGDLKSAKTFIDKYFDRLLDIPNSIKNLNYRSKYAKIAYWKIDEFNSSEVKDNTLMTKIHVSELGDINKFKGTGIHKKLDWLTSRLRLLDAYFNINPDVSYRLKKAILTNPRIESGSLIVDDVLWEYIYTNTGGYYLYPQNKVGVDFGDDISINSQIFGGDTKSTLSVNTFHVKAPSFTPVIIFQAGLGAKAFLIGDDTGADTYSIPINTVGNLAWGIYGSKEFTYISNLGLVKLNNVLITSDKLKDVTYVDSPEIGSPTSEFTLNTPNVRSITFNSTKYSGLLTLASSSYNRLTSVNLSGSKVYVNSTNALPITNLNLSNMDIPDNSMLFTNLSAIETVNIDGSSFKDLTLPMWKQLLSITSNSSTVSSTLNYDCHSVSVKNLSLTESRYSLTTLILNNVPSLEKIKIGDFVETLEVYDCPKLATVVIGTKLKKLIINNCSNTATKLSIIPTDSTTESGLIDLSLCNNGNIELNLYNTKKFNTISIGNNTIVLPKEALAYCSDLMYLVNSSNGKYLIEGSRVFYDDNKFTLKSSNATVYPILLVSDNIATKDSDNLTSLFHVTVSSNAIDFGAADAFITKNVSRASNVTNITNLFYGLAGIGVEWNFNSYFTNLNKYTSIKNATRAFHGCGINYWSKELFNFGALLLNATGVFFNSTVNAQVDFLENIGSKLTTYNDTNVNGSGLTYTFYNGDTEITDVRLADVMLYLTNITSLNGFRSITGTSVDLKDCFANCIGITSVFLFMWGNNNWKNVVYTNDLGEITSCFQVLSNLKTIGGCFSASSVVPGNEYLDIYNVLSQTQWASCTSLFSLNLTNFGNTLACNKLITLEDFDTLKSCLQGSPITILANIFRNCCIINCGDSNPSLDIYSNPKTGITLVYRLYDGLKAYSGTIGTNRVPVTLLTLMQNLPNVTSCLYAFSNNWIKGHIPFNFFGKRGNMVNKVGYYPSIYLPPIDPEDGGYEYVYFISTEYHSEGTYPALPANVSRDISVYSLPELFPSGATSGWTVTRQTLSNLDVGSIKTTFAKPEFWRAKREKPIEQGQDYGEFNTPELMERRDASISVDVRYTPYENRKITNITGIFYNTLFTEPYFKYEEEWYIDDSLRSYIKSGLNNYPRYYTTLECTSVGVYRLSTEMEDLDIGRNSGVYRADLVTVNGSNFYNYSTVHNSRETNIDYPFIAPDFFLGLSTTGLNISYAFGNSISTTTNITQLSTDVTLPSYQLEGYVPEHLMSSVAGISTWTDFMLNLNIFPVKYQDTRKYVFIPLKFIPVNLGNFLNLFNFHIRIPEWTLGSADNPEFYVMYSNSVSGVSSASSATSNMLPRYVTHGDSTNSVIWSSASGGARDVVADDYNFNYHIILDANGVEGTFDSYSSFSNSHYDGLISEDLLYVLSGKVWSDNYPLNRMKNNNKAVFEGIVTVSTLLRGFNKYFIPPATTTSFSSSIFAIRPNRINENSVPSAYLSAWTGTFGLITFLS